MFRAQRCAKMYARYAEAIYTGATAVATFLLSFLSISMVCGQSDALMTVLIVLIAAVTYCAGLACRHILIN